MQLKNRFSEEDKQRVWGYLSCCAVCASNINCSVHHIDSTLSFSIYNSILLCEEHHIIADGHNQSDEEFKRTLTKIALAYVLRSGHKDTKEDLRYLKIIEPRLKKILEEYATIEEEEL